MANPLTRGFVNALIGKGAHLSPKAVLEGLSVAQVRRRPVKGLATIWEQLAHIVYWQDFLLRVSEGKEPKAPRSAELGWPAMPPLAGSRNGWAKLVKRFERGLAAAALIAEEKTPTAGVKPGSRRTFGGILLTLADHNSYHLGQIVTLRRLIGSWPPHSGGTTW
jgi:uncharacterized damage-inducible protein DinB